MKSPYPDHTLHARIVPVHPGFTFITLSSVLKLSAQIPRSPLSKSCQRDPSLTTPLVAHADLQQSGPLRVYLYRGAVSRARHKDRKGARLQREPTC